MPDIFLPDERLSLEEAVWIYTAGGAIAAGEEKRLGSIEPGFLADLTVLELEGGGAEKLLENARCDCRVCCTMMKKEARGCTGAGEGGGGRGGGATKLVSGHESTQDIEYGTKW